MNSTEGPDHVQNVKDGVDEVADHRYFRRMAKVGFTARGVLFLTVGALAGSVGLTSSQDADTTGAINQLSDNSFGSLILVVLTVGLASYAALRLVHVVVNPSDADGLRGAAMRVAYLVQAIAYGGLTVFTVRKLLGSGGGGGDSEEQATSQALELPLGAWLVGAVALVLVGVAVAQTVRAVNRDFMDHAPTGGRARTFMLWTGTIGHAARGVLFGMIAWLLGQAALQSDSSDAGGTDAAIQELAVTTGGSVLLLAVAVGVAAYGAWCLAMARWGSPRHEG